MKLPIVPASARFTPERFVSRIPDPNWGSTWTPAPGEISPLLEPPMIEDKSAPRPAFIYRPLSQKETIEFARQVRRAEAGENGDASEIYLRLFHERVTGAELFEVADGQPYVHEEHKEVIAPSVAIEVGVAIYVRAQLSEDDEGKSFSPSA